MTLSTLLKSFSEEDTPEARAKDEISLTGVLQRKRLKFSKLKKPRAASLFFSPYNLGYGFCMREKVAQRAGLHTIWVKPPTPKEELVFAVGNAYHEMIQGFFWKTGMLEGHWKCQVCAACFYARSPAACTSCGASDFLEYREVPLFEPDLQVRGRSDGIIWVEVAKDVEEKHIMDIKSISNKNAQYNPNAFRCFEDLEEQGPVPQHLVQLQSYMRMSGIPDGHLLYVAKNTQALKSFHIKYSAQFLEPYLEDIRTCITWANEIQEGKRKDLPAPCSSKKCECQAITFDKSKLALKEVK